MQAKVGWQSIIPCPKLVFDLAIWQFHVRRGILPTHQSVNFKNLLLLMRLLSSWYIRNKESSSYAIRYTTTYSLFILQSTILIPEYVCGIM